MGWELEEHTADVRLRVEAADWPALLREAVTAFGEFVAGGPSPQGTRVERFVEAEGADTNETWVRFWRALHRLWTVEGLLPVAARATADSTAIRAGAHVSCIPAAELDASRCEDVKAVTWHAAEAGLKDGAWVGQIVLDV